MAKYSIFNIIKNAFNEDKNWARAWRDPEPKKSYDVIIIGAGGHGLASAFYLAKNHGIRNIAVLERLFRRRKHRSEYHYRQKQLHAR